MQDPLSNAEIQLRQVLDLLGKPQWYERFSKPDRLLCVSIPVQMDDGTMKVFTGFRSQHNNSRGPYKGGIRFHQQVSESEVQALSMWMTWKCAIANIPYGGGKGGIIVDPTTLSESELEKLSREFVRRIAPIIGEDVDVPAPDVNTDPKIMAWMLDEYEQFLGKKSPATFTGKPVEKGGSQGRTQATGFGGVYCMQKILELEGKPTTGMKIVIQGFGNVGSFFAKAAFDAGHIILGLSDSKGAIVCATGINPYEAEKYKLEKKTFAGFPGTTTLSNEELLTHPCDILVPSALENVITQANAEKLSCTYVVEMANGPVTPEADSILAKRGILPVPDVLANSGGVTASYFEWVQNKENTQWNEANVLSKLKETITTATEQSYSMHIRLGCSMRMGAYANAVARVIDATK